MTHLLYAIMLLASTFALSCNEGPEPINYGKDACDHCRMTIMDPKFGAELVTAKGKVYKFDDVNCMVSFMNEGPAKGQEASHVLIVDFLRPMTLMPVKDAHFLRSDEVRSPMASGVAAFSDASQRAQHLDKWGGEPMNWEDVKKAFE
jgi:copper chaperone NosL